jgi:hypothetical protein
MKTDNVFRDLYCKHVTACAMNNPAGQSSVHLVCRTFFCKLVVEAIIALCSCRIQDWLCTRAGCVHLLRLCAAPLLPVLRSPICAHECNPLAWQATCTLLNYITYISSDDTVLYDTHLQSPSYAQRPDAMLTFRRYQTYLQDPAQRIRDQHRRVKSPTQNQSYTATH